MGRNDGHSTFCLSVTMPIPHLFFGQTANVLLELDATTSTDAGAPYSLYAVSNRVAPAGAGGECIFPVLYLTVTYASAGAIDVTPLVDGIALERQRVSLPGPGGVAETKVYELGVSVPYLVEGVERARFAARGTWLQVRVETNDPITVESIEAEVEIVRESKVASGEVQ